jgi:hypothetical protein
LKKCADLSVAPFDIWKVILDGKPIFQSGFGGVNGQLKDEIQVKSSTQFNLTIPRHHYYPEATPGTYPAVVAGYYLPLKPLKPGEHTLYYKISYTPPGLASADHEATYYFTVQPRH